MTERQITELLLLSHCSRVWLCGTPSLGFSRQGHWSGLPFPSPMHKSEKWKWSRWVMSDSSRPHGLQPTRLLCPWDFPGKSTGVGCHCLLRITDIRICKCINSGKYIKKIRECEWRHRFKLHQQVEEGWIWETARILMRTQSPVGLLVKEKERSSISPRFSILTCEKN